jgi:selenocysteine lyase/cysteine desulfurase
LYVADHIKGMLNQRAMGWNSLVDFGTAPTQQENWKVGASSFELGHLKYVNLIIYGHAIKEINEIGIKSIHNRIASLRAYLTDQLIDIGVSPISPATDKLVSSGIVTIKADSSLHNWLTQHHIISTHREDYLRISMHFYNDFDDVDRLVEAILGYSRSN